MRFAAPVVPGEAPVALVEIRSAAFHPHVLEIDPAVWTTVRWENTDTDRTYVIVFKEDDIESPPIPPGGSCELDVTGFAPGLHRYTATIGEVRVPWTIDIAPEP